MVKGRHCDLATTPYLGALRLTKVLWCPEIYMSTCRAYPKVFTKTLTSRFFRLQSVESLWCRRIPIFSCLTIPGRSFSHEWPAMAPLSPKMAVIHGCVTHSWPLRTSIEGHSKVDVGFMHQCGWPCLTPFTIFTGQYQRLSFSSDKGRKWTFHPIQWLQVNRTIDVILSPPSVGSTDGYMRWRIVQTSLSRSTNFAQILANSFEWKWTHCINLPPMIPRCCTWIMKHVSLRNHMWSEGNSHEMSLLDGVFSLSWWNSQKTHPITLKMHSLLYDGNVSKDEAVLYAVSLINITPCTSNNGQSPLYRTMDQEPDLSLVRTLWGVFVSHIPVSHHKKINRILHLLMDHYHLSIIFWDLWTIKDLHPLILPCFMLFRLHGTLHS
jgi:hypothetical protein